MVQGPESPTPTGHPMLWSPSQLRAGVDGGLPSEPWALGLPYPPIPLTSTPVYQSLLSNPRAITCLQASSFGLGSPGFIRLCAQIQDAAQKCLFRKGPSDHWCTSIHTHVHMVIKMAIICLKMSSVPGSKERDTHTVWVKMSEQERRAIWPKS